MQNQVEQQKNQKDSIMNIEQSQKKSFQNQAQQEQAKLTDNTFIKVQKHLESKKIKYQVIHHQQVRTSLEASNIRKTPLEWGSKTMLIKSPLSQLPILLIYRAHLQLDWKKIRKISFIGKKMKMLNDQQVQQFGVKPGGVPPFAQVLNKKCKTVLDDQFESQKIDGMAFNAGAKDKSIIIRYNKQFKNNYNWNQCENCSRFSITKNLEQKQQNLEQKQ